MPADLSVRSDLVIALTYYPPYVSGLTNMARDIAQGLAGRGRTVTVVTSRFDRSLPREEVRDGVRVLRAPVLARVGRGVISPAFVTTACREMARARVGSLHLPLLEAAPIARGAGCPLVVTYHCDVTLPRGAINTAQQRVVDASNRAAMRVATAVSVTSEDYARHSRMWPAIQPSMVVIPPPCREVPPGRPTYRETDGPHVGFLGRIVREKGLEYLLLIGGDHATVAGGTVVEQVRAAIGDDPRIRLLGFVPEERLGDFYASLEVFTLPSVNAFEAFGIVQAVAMLAGVPVLSSDIPGARQPGAQTRFGTLVPPADPAAITAGLRALIADPPDREAGARAAHRAFSVDGVLDAYEALMDKAAAESSRR